MRTEVETSQESMLFREPRLGAEQFRRTGDNDLRIGWRASRQHGRIAGNVAHGDPAANELSLRDLFVHPVSAMNVDYHGRPRKRQTVRFVFQRNTNRDALSRTQRGLAVVEFV